MLECDLRGRDQDEEADPVEGAKVQVLCAGVCYGTNMGQQLSGHCQLDGPNLTPLYGVFYTDTNRNSYHHTQSKSYFKHDCPGLNCAHLMAGRNYMILFFMFLGKSIG